MTPTDTHLGLRAFCEELARAGVNHACTSPGSRNTPLLLSLVREPGLATSSHIDERSGAFFALGLAKVAGDAVALCCTSGTAAANYLPAVVEAWESRVPLIVLTADRPPELRDLGAGQTIDQVKLYGRNAKWYLEIDEAPATPERMRWMRWLACRAVAVATSGRPGPVHLNFALREPLVLDGALPDEPGGGGRPDGRPWVSSPSLPFDGGALLINEIRERPRALFVAGALKRGGEDLAHLASRCRLPLLADPLSGARGGEAIAHYDLFLREPRWADAHRPDLVIRVGDLPTSKPLRQWLAGLTGARQIAIDPEGVWQDPASVVEQVLPVDLGGLEETPVPWGPEGWIDAWLAADERAREAVGHVLGDGVSEPLVAARTHVRLDAADTLVVASSMPIRDIEAFAVTKFSPPRVISNRGANGIDGTVSTALGAAAANPVGQKVLPIGDVALIHDIGALVSARRLGLKLTIVLLNNDGGGIFHFLPVAEEAEIFEEHVATPHGLDFGKVAAVHGLEYARPAAMTEFQDAYEAALAGTASTLIEIRTDRRENRDLHARIAEAVRAAI